MNRRTGVRPCSFRLAGGIPAAAVSMLAVYACASTGGSSGPASAPRVVSGVLSADNSIDSVWPGYSLRDRDWIVYDSGGAFLVSSRGRPAQFEDLPDSVSIPSAFRDRVYWRPGPLPGLTRGIDTRYEIDGRIATAVPARADARLTGIFHEAFHTYQAERFDQDDEVNLSSVTDRITPEYAAALTIERRILDEALRARGDREAVLVREFLALRIMRQRSTPASLVAAERSAEAREGLADYVGQIAAARARGQPDERAHDHFRLLLRVPLRPPNTAGDSKNRLIRVRAYGTGATMAVLLDRRRNDWKRDAERGAPLDSLLAAAAGMDTVDIVQLDASVRERRGHAELLAASDPPWGSLDDLTEADLLARAPYRLILEVSRAASRNASFTPGPGGIQTPTPGLVALPDVLYFDTHDGTAFTLAVEGRTVSFDTRGPDPARGVMTVILPAPPLLNGQAVVAGVAREMSGVTLTGDGVTLTIPGTARVFTDSVSIRIAPR